MLIGKSNIMNTPASRIYNTLRIVGTVLCTLFLAYTGLVAFVSINWHHHEGMSGWMFPAFVCGLVLRIVRMNLLRWMLLLFVDVVIMVRVYDELLFTSDFGFYAGAFKGPFWIVLAGTLLLLADWTVRLIVWKQQKSLNRNMVAAE